MSGDGDMREFLSRNGVTIMILLLSLLVQGTLLYAAIVQRVDTVVEDQNRILMENNIEHQRLWSELGKPTMWRYIVPLRDSGEHGLRKVTP